QSALTPSAIGQRYLNAIGQVNLITQTGDNLVNNLVQTLSINPNAAALSGDQTQILTINYDLTRSSEASIAAVFSPNGVDFSRKQFLEMWMLGDGSVAASSATQTQINV